MAEHKVLADVGSFDVGMVDVVFKVYRNNGIFGRLRVSQGSVEWQQAGGKKYVFSLGWSKLDRLFVQEGREVRKRMIHGPLRRRA